MINGLVAEIAKGVSIGAFFLEVYTLSAGRRGVNRIEATAEGRPQEEIDRLVQELATIIQELAYGAAAATTLALAVTVTFTFGALHGIVAAICTLPIHYLVFKSASPLCIEPPQAEIPEDQ